MTECQARGPLKTGYHFHTLSNVHTNTCFMYVDVVIFLYIGTQSSISEKANAMVFRSLGP